MKRSFYKLLFFLLVLAGCAGNNRAFYKGLRKSKSVRTYKGSVNEFQDGYLVLKENNYFVYYDRIWLLFNLKQVDNAGRYTQSNDTLYLNWLSGDPRSIHQFLTNTCVLDSAQKGIWFFDVAENNKTWGLNLYK
jgi:hypothetical protein